MPTVPSEEEVVVVGEKRPQPPTEANKPPASAVVATAVDKKRARIVTNVDKLSEAQKSTYSRVCEERQRYLQQWWHASLPTGLRKSLVWHFNRLLPKFKHLLQGERQVVLQSNAVRMVALFAAERHGETQQLLQELYDTVNDLPCDESVLREVLLSAATSREYGSKQAPVNAEADTRTVWEVSPAHMKEALELEPVDGDTDVLQNDEILLHVRSLKKLRTKRQKLVSCCDRVLRELEKKTAPTDAKLTELTDAITKARKALTDSESEVAARVDKYRKQQAKKQNKRQAAAQKAIERQRMQEAKQAAQQQKLQDKDKKVPKTPGSKKKVVQSNTLFAMFGSSIKKQPLTQATEEVLTSMTPLTPATDILSDYVLPVPPSSSARGHRSLPALLPCDGDSTDVLASLQQRLRTWSQQKRRERKSARDLARQIRSWQRRDWHKAENGRWDMQPLSEVEQDVLHRLRRPSLEKPFELLPLKSVSFTSCYDKIHLADAHAYSGEDLPHVYMNDTFWGTSRIDWEDALAETRISGRRPLYRDADTEDFFDYEFGDVKLEEGDGIALSDDENEEDDDDNQGVSPTPASELDDFLAVEPDIDDCADVHSVMRLGVVRFSRSQLAQARKNPESAAPKKSSESLALTGLDERHKLLVKFAKVCSITLTRPPKKRRKKRRKKKTTKKSASDKNKSIKKGSASVKKKPKAGSTVKKTPSKTTTRTISIAALLQQQAAKTPQK
ncbi:MAG: hypothetical protein MHM6MM_003290 [Cercozoa sp. M6MM]